MSTVGDALKALKTVLLMQDDIRALNEKAQAQGDRVARLAEAHADLRDRVSRLEGVIEGAAMASRQRRIEE
ncbi:hypothetical protein [uncultured Sphingomonas sp.]|uniref:hypothetical protein n=1 Tax=uncultured Sphingomonas sp. TaxID=158754 RepID=UPI0035CCA016